MSSVCNLCGEWTDKDYLPRVRVTPDLPSSVAERAGICYDCKRAIGSVDNSDSCNWCGGAAKYEVWNIGAGPMGGSGLKDILGYLCEACWAKARGQYPRKFSEKLKESVRRESDNECAECGMPQKRHKQEFGQKLHIHHKDGDKTNNRTDNLTALCARCHGSK